MTLSNCESKPDAGQQKELKRIKSRSPAIASTRNTSQLQTDAHKEAVDLFSDYAKNGDDDRTL